MIAVKERPILFSASMVRALLDGSKTQTRRIVKPANVARAGSDGVELWTGFMGWQLAETLLADQSLSTSKHTRCPYGQPGDRLWVRETWAQPAALDPGPTVYRADYPACVPPQFTNLPSVDEITWKPSIHMFRRGSRILLEIVAVRIERLNDCSESDAKAEGVLDLDADDWQRPEVRTKEGWALCTTCAGTGLHNTLAPNGGVNCDVDCHECDTHVKLYRHLWESINGAGSWAANPWVWVIEFKRVAI